MGRWLLIAALAAQVQIANFRFEPQTLEIPAGSSVTWRNTDEEIHSIFAADGSFSSPGMDTDETFTRTFTAPGTYVYRCALHPQMSGTIVVR